MRLLFLFFVSCDALTNVTCLDTKTADNKSTIFEVIVQMIKDQTPQFATYTKDQVELVTGGSRVSLPTVEADLKKLLKDFETVSGIYPKVAKDGDDDLFQG